MSDHMLLVEHHAETGWTDPVIKPYGTLPIDPIASCLQYSTNLFEGMKVRVTFSEFRAFYTNMHHIVGVLGRGWRD